MINKELIINAIKRASIDLNVPRTPEELDDGFVASTKPFTEKSLTQMLRDLNAFALTGGDAKRNAASESTSTTEVSIDNDAADIKNQTFMLESAWGYLARSTDGTGLSSELENTFNSYIKVVREISSWVVYLANEKDNVSVEMGASSISTLLQKWGPVGLSDDLDDFYPRLYDHIYDFSLAGKVLALLDSKPVGLRVKSFSKTDVKFDHEGYADVKLPMQDPTGTQPTCEYYITDIDYITAQSNCGRPDITTVLDYEECDNEFTLQLTHVDGDPICITETRTFVPPVDPPDVDPPPPIYPPVDPPITPPPPTVGDPLAIGYTIDCSSSGDAIMKGSTPGFDCWAQEVAGEFDIGNYASYTNHPSLRVSLSGARNSLSRNPCCTHR
ncbi:MAG: hypothetical protein B7C24_10100 [Bacteroidetes bacterium 4572_77]|nr:MAG: hypothetical protein B7C24_10100 [Bacteroidetes bacterium 4572_77]